MRINETPFRNLKRSYKFLKKSISMSMNGYEHSKNTFLKKIKIHCKQPTQINNKQNLKLL